MPNEKYQQYAQLAIQTAEQITKSLQQWTDFLTTAGRLYKYPYHEQLMIYAQRPEASACATYDLWNNTMGRYVRRGNHGIALLDTDGDGPRLKYVFDVSDTGARERSRTPYLWSYQNEHFDAVSAALEQRYDIPAANGLAEQLESIAAQLVDAYWENNQSDILGIVDGSFLEEYDDFNIGMAFRNAAVVSTTYMLLSRCGLEPEHVFTHEDFLPVFDFNTPATVAALGTAISQSSEQVLRQIETVIKNYERAKLAERTDYHDRTEVQQKRGLPDSQPEPERTRNEASGQVRTDAEAVSERAAPSAVEPDDSQRNPVLPSAGDRRNSEPETGADHAGVDVTVRSDGSSESRRPDGLDRPDEQPENAGGGNDLDGADLQLSQTDEIASDGQLELFPSEEAQIQSIAEAESVNEAPSALSFSQADIDAVLQRGSGIENGKLRIYALFQQGTDRSAAKAFLKEEYGPYSGHSHTFLDGSYGFATYTGKGLNLRRSEDPVFETNLTWTAIEKRLRQLVEEGRYLTDAEQAQYTELEREYAGYGGIPVPIARYGFPEPEALVNQEEIEPNQSKVSDSTQSSNQADSPELERAKQLINSYSQREFGQDADYSNLNKVDLAFTSTEDGEHTLQASVDLIAFRMLYEVDGESVAAIQFHDLAELNELLADLDFTEQITFAEDRWLEQTSHAHEVDPEEYDPLDDVGPAAIRERLAQAGIVNGELVDPDALDRDPFIQQVMQDVEAISQETEEQRLEDTTGISPEEETYETQSRESDSGPAYIVGDTVYLDDTAYEITAVGEFDIQLQDPAQRYPIFRSESRDGFERELSRDRRNAAITDYLPTNLDQISGYLRDALTWDGGLLDQKAKEQVSELFRNGAGNARVASFLAASYGGSSIEMTMPSGDIGRLTADIHALDLRVRDSEGDIINASRTSWESIAPILRAMYQQDRNGFFREPILPEPEVQPAENTEPNFRLETVVVYDAERNGLPYDIEIQTLHIGDPEHEQPEQVAPAPIAENFHITDDHLGEGGPKAKFQANMAAINTLKQIEFEGRSATPEEQEILSRYVGWGGLADAFDDTKPNWSEEFQELYTTLSPEEYAAARSSTLNAHYTSPTVIRAMYEAIGDMGFQAGNILEPSMGVGNFFGMLPKSMENSRLYGVELDSISGRIAKQLYPKADITVAGFETTDRRDFFDLAIGNVPFGNYQVSDKTYDKLWFSIHNYFIAKALDQVRPGGIVAFVTSRYTMDAKDPSARKYIAQRADLLGAIRLPNNAFKANAGTDVVSDILFLQKRDTPIETEPDWVHLGENPDGFTINSYFVDHPEMILGAQSSESTQYGHQDFTVEPIEGAELADQLHEAIQNIRGTYQEAELPELGEGEDIDASIPADPNVKNYSYTIVDDEVYYRQDSRMVKPDLNATAVERVKGMVALRDCVHQLIEEQMDGYTSDSQIQNTQQALNDLYDKFSAKFGLINDRANRLAFADDSSYYLLCSLEVLDENKNLERKADMFTKRTIRPHQAVTSVDTAAEALALSISEKAGVDMAYMSRLTGKDENMLADELRGVIFRVPNAVHDDGRPVYQAADEYLSGNVREKLRTAELAANHYPDLYNSNVEALQAAQPKDLDASEIEVRLGATWIDKQYIQQFMEETFHVPYYQRRAIQVNYSEFTAEWNITGKSQCSYNDVNAYVTYGTQRVNAYKILEDTLNLRDVRLYDTVKDPDGKERRVLNSKETTLAQQKQQAIKDAFQEWVWNDPDRRHALVAKYNELFNSTRPREYSGDHITFSGMNPEISLREHQKNAIAHILYGGNTLLAHEVGAGKTFEMVAAAMESKRLGLCQKSLFAVPNHLTEQWASEFLRLYPSANILVATKKDFEPANRKKFCARIATGDYDAVIIGHSQFEKIPVSKERQEQMLMDQIEEIQEGIQDLKYSRGERFTIKQMEKTKKSLEAKLKKLQADGKKDDVVTFEQLGVDRLFVDEAHNYKNCAKRCA